MSFSIVIPFFNAQDFLKNAIESIKMQTYKGDYEIILIDDCSNDESFKIAKDLKNENEKIILLQTTTNLGPGIARNLAFKKASKDWMIFLDSDDLLTKNALDLINQNISNDIDFIAYDAFNGGGAKRYE